MPKRSFIPSICNRPGRSWLKYPTGTSIRAPISTAQCSRQRPRRSAHISQRRRPTRSTALPPPTRHSRGHQIPIARRTPTRPPIAVSSLGGFRNAGPPEYLAPSSWGRHPKTFTRSDIARPAAAGDNTPFRAATGPWKGGGQKSIATDWKPAYRNPGSGRDAPPRKHA
jgi:hypothetical protein